MTTGSHYISITPVLIWPIPKPRTFERQALLPGLWLEHINGDLGRIAHNRSQDPTITEMRDTIIADLPAYVRGLVERIKKSNVEIPLSIGSDDGGWHVEHPLEMHVEDEDIRKLVMISCILAGAETFIVDRPVLAELRDRAGIVTPEFDRWDRYRHVWQKPYNPAVKSMLADSEPGQFSELDLSQVRHYCEILEPYFRPVKWHEGRLAIALGAFLSYALGPGDSYGYLALMTVFEALLSTTKFEISHQICERLAFMLESNEAGRYSTYRRMKQLYDTRSQLVHGSVENKRGPISYDRLRVWRRYARLLGPDPAADVKDELRFHLEAKIDDLIAQGLTPEAAHQEAERQFGDVRALQQIGICIGEKMERRKRLEDYWSDSLQDVRYAMRTLGRDPGFAIISIVILSVGHRSQYCRLQRGQHAAPAAVAVP